MRISRARMLCIVAGLSLAWGCGKAPSPVDVVSPDASTTTVSIGAPCRASDADRGTHCRDLSCGAPIAATCENGIWACPPTYLECGGGVCQDNPPSALVASCACSPSCDDNAQAWSCTCPDRDGGDADADGAP